MTQETNTRSNTKQNKHTHRQPEVADMLPENGRNVLKQPVGPVSDFQFFNLIYLRMRFCDQFVEIASHIVITEMSIRIRIISSCRTIEARQVPEIFRQQSIFA